MRKCSVSISFEPELMAAINEYCSEKGCSRSWLVNKAVSEYFKKLEDEQESYDIENLNPRPNPYAKS